MSWYAVHTRSRHEEIVHRGLLQKSINAFLPKMEVWSKRKDRRKKITVPVFSGYIFAEFQADNQSRVHVLTTPGVVRILGRRGSSDPIAVPDEQIEAVRRLVESKVEIQRVQYPEIGETARITDGPFKGIEGVVVQIDFKKDLFVVSIDLLQRSVAIQLEGFQIERL